MLFSDFGQISPVCYALTVSWSCMSLFLTRRIVLNEDIQIQEYHRYDIFFAGLTWFLPRHFFSVWASCILLRIAWPDILPFAPYLRIHEPHNSFAVLFPCIFLCSRSLHNSLFEQGPAHSYFGIVVFFSGKYSIGQVIIFVPSSFITNSENIGSACFPVSAVVISPVFLAFASAWFSWPL